MKKYIIPVLIGFLFVGCTRDDINNDPNAAYTTIPSTLLTYSQKELSDYMNTCSVNENNFRLTMQYWQETVYINESIYDFTNRNVSNTIFIDNYVNVLNNLTKAKGIINDYVPSATELDTWPGIKKNQLAIIDIMQVYTYQNLVDTFGNVPYSQSNQLATIPTPVYDDAASIYNDLISRLDKDITDLDQGNSLNFGSADLYYNGDVGKWKKFGSSLLLKLGIALADANPTLAQSTVTKAVNYGVMTSSADNCKLQYLSASPNFNPIFENVVASGRNDFVAGKTLIDFMNASTDPRMNSYFDKNLHYTLGKVASINTTTPGTTFTLEAALPTTPVPVIGDGVYIAGEYLGNIASISGNSITINNIANVDVAVGNTLQYSYYYKGGTIGSPSGFGSNTHLGDFAYTPTTPGVLLNYTEVAFYLTEASARWGIGGAPAANYANAITTSFIEWGLTSGDATTYITAHPYNASNWKQSVGEQAWLAMYNQPLTSWNFWRRLDYPALSAPPAASPITTVPVRMMYPISESTTNGANWAAAGAAIGGDKLNTKIFWDKN